jgi:hypothetical protein
MIRAHQTRVAPFEPRPINAMGSGEAYLLTGVEECTSKQGTRYLKLSLENKKGPIKGFVWPEVRPYVSCPPLHSPILIRGNEHHYSGCMQPVGTGGPIDDD